MKRIIFLSFLIFPVLLTALKAGGAGTLINVALMKPLNPRAEAMGQAYTACENDVLGIFNNPVVLNTGKEISVVYTRGIMDDMLGLIGYNFPLKKYNITFAGVYYTAGSIELIDSGENINTMNAQTDFMGLLSFSTKNKKFPLNFGMNIKWLSSNLVQEFNASCLAADAGITYSFNRKLFLACVYQNLSTAFKYSEAEYHLPQILRLGISYDFLKDTGKEKKRKIKHGLIWKCDAVYIQEAESIKLHTGIEYKYGNSFILRGGYKYGYKTIDGLTFGLGIMIKNYGLDYAFVPLGQIDSVHQLALTYKFLPVKKR